MVGEGSVQVKAGCWTPLTVIWNAEMVAPRIIDTSAPVPVHVSDGEVPVMSKGPGVVGTTAFGKVITVLWDGWVVPVALIVAVKVSLTVAPARRLRTDSGTVTCAWRPESVN